MSTWFRLEIYPYQQEVSSFTPFVGRIFCVGIFDGVHAGHRELLDKASLLAKKSCERTALWTFGAPFKSSLESKKSCERVLHPLLNQKRLEEAGLDELHILENPAQIFQLSAKEFLEDILIKKLHATGLVLGENARMGKNRASSASDILTEAKNLNLLTAQVPLLKRADESKISSSFIKNCIKKGLLKEAEFWLKGSFEIGAFVVEGKQLGRSLGYPTANLKLDGQVLPPDGVYACEVCLNPLELQATNKDEADNGKTGKNVFEKTEKNTFAKGRVLAMAYLGSRPTVDGVGPRLLEVHIPNWQGDLYGKFISVRPLRFLRSSQRFDSVQALKNQIAQDLKQL